MVLATLNQPWNNEMLNFLFVACKVHTWKFLQLLLPPDRINIPNFRFSIETCEDKRHRHSSSLYTEKHLSIIRTGQHQPGIHDVKNASWQSAISLLTNRKILVSKTLTVAFIFSRLFFIHCRKLSLFSCRFRVTTIVRGWRKVVLLDLILECVAWIAV